jgi:hypothetical protein
MVTARNRLNFCGVVAYWRTNKAKERYQTKNKFSSKLKKKIETIIAPLLTNAFALLSFTDQTNPNN